MPCDSGYQRKPCNTAIEGFSLQRKVTIVLLEMRPGESYVTRDIHIHIRAQRL